MRVLIASAFLLISCISNARDEYRPMDLSLELKDSEISIVSYNVENLFDTKHDAGTEDFEFLPLKNEDGSPNKIKIDACNRMPQEWQQKQCMEVDWTEHKLKMKLQKISDVLHMQGDLPDILALVEVENANVVGQLADVLGYSKQNLKISTGSDERGINVAVLYKTRNIEYHSHKEAVVKVGTRNILVVNFKVKNSDALLGVYVNHWPSQGNDVSERMNAAKTLNTLIDEQSQKLGSKYHVVSVGDFNVTQYDRPHPIINTVEDRANGLRDTLHILKKEDENLFYQLPTGTSYFVHGGTWDYLDKILVSQNLLVSSSLVLAKKSFRILAFPEISNPFEVKNPLRHSAGNILQRIPNRYNFKAESPDKTGYSDHYPLRILLETRSK